MASRWRRRPLLGALIIAAFGAVPILALGITIVLSTSSLPSAETTQVRRAVYLTAAVLLVGLVTLVRFAALAGHRRIELEVDAAQAHAEAIEASELKSQFLANMSHEIRTPLNGVLGMTSLLLDTELTDAQRDLATTAYRSGEELLVVINEVLDFSRIESGRVEIDVVDFDLRSLAEDVCRLMAATAETRNVELICVVDAEVPYTLRGDPVRVRQVLSNLVGNAVKFTEQGEVVVRVSLEGREVDDAGGEVGRVHFEVVDTGIGIPIKAQATLFEPFVQADSSTTRRYGGSGLGLAIADRLVGLMGGSIAFTSVVGSGSTFWFTVPLGVGREAVDVAPMRKLALEGRRGLVVDDSEVARDMLTRILVRWGMSVDAVPGGAQALEVLEEAAGTEHPVEVVLLDLNMPDLDGVAVTEAIRARHGRTPKIVMLTSSAQRGEVSRGHSAGIDGYLTKPMREEELRAVVATVLGSPTDVKPITRHDVREQARADVPSLLLAEDNPVNQKVGVGMIERLGYRADVVGDGEAAVLAAASGRYRMILMDCQMPVLDGYDATRRIRGLHLEREPVIVALTASASKIDRDRCLEAGMDDHLAKPINPEALNEMILRWIDETGGRPLARVDIDLLQRLLGGDVALMTEVVDTFAADATDQVGLLVAAVDRGDLVTVAASAHRLRGGAGYLGASTLAELCARLEEHASAGDLAAVQVAASILGEAVDATIGLLRSGVVGTPA